MIALCRHSRHLNAQLLHLSIRAFNIHTQPLHPTAQRLNPAVHPLKLKFQPPELAVRRVNCGVHPQRLNERSTRLHDEPKNQRSDLV